MPSYSWWLPEKQKDLSQGDIVTGLPSWIAVPPLIYVEKRTMKGSQHIWSELREAKPDDEEFSHILIRSREIVGVVLAHDCELDKGNRKQRVQFARADRLDALNADEQTKVLNQGSLRLLVLPDVPTIGTYYADMRLIFTVDKRLVMEDRRVASMTEEAKVRLQNQLIAFFADRERPEPASNS